MTINEILLGVGAETPAHFLQVFLNSAIPAHFTRQTALPTDPLPVNVEITLKLRSVSLDTRLRAQYDG